MCGAVGCGAVRFDEGSVLGSPAWCVQLSAHPPQTPFLLASDKCGHPSGFHINTARERVNCSYPPIKKKKSLCILWAANVGSAHPDAMHCHEAMH